MGCNSSKENAEEAKQNQAITKYLREEKKRLDQEVKLLLLGKHLLLFV